MLLDGRNLPTGETQLLEADALSGPLGDRVFDDCFDELISDEQGVAVFSVADRHRMVSVELGPGFPCAQVYAPHDSQLICFEPMTAPVNALSSGDGLRLVEPGGSFSAQFAVAVGAA
jgi:aldose 1-epimerase